MKRITLFFIPLLLLLFILVLAQVVPVPTTLNDFFLPGSQPGQSGNTELPDKCDNCHGGYDLSVEPSFNWRGGMMSQAARDPFYYACMAIANQDAPESGDLCIRCHSPRGWLDGRSTPTDGSALTSGDREGVHCGFCHKMVMTSPLGENPFPEDSVYTADTYSEDQAYLADLSHIPGTTANGMFINSDEGAKRGPFVDAVARHQMYYSPLHQTSDLCGTCHDVSNPVYERTVLNTYVPNDFDSMASNFDPYTMFPVERTYSEWLKSAYNSPEGVYAPQFGGNKAYVSTCQDCHLRDVTGAGANKKDVPIRNDLPLHDMTGGNTFIAKLIDQLYPGESDTAALNQGIGRARSMLELAAFMEVNMDGKVVTVKVTNQTGHKLPSGYPEGRRIWIHLTALNNSGVFYESGAYNFLTADLIHDPDIKIYEIKPGISKSLSPVVNFPAGPSFHFVLNDTIYKDNRIPPRGFSNTSFEDIQSPPVGYAYADGQYWDETVYILDQVPTKVEATLYYQTTSKEYVEFLRDENHTNDWGLTFYGLWEDHGMSEPVIMQSASQTLNGFIDTEAAVGGSLVLFNEGDVDPGDGHTVEMTFNSLSGSGDITVLQLNQAPANPPELPYIEVAWNISKSAGIDAFSSDAVFHYTDEDISGMNESKLRVYFWNGTAWQYMGGTVNQADNEVAVSLSLTGDFALFETDEVLLACKVFMEGPYQAGTGMRTLLQEAGWIPITSPYSDNRVVARVPSQITDWVFVELRSTANGTLVAGRSFFLRNDGIVTDDNGITTDLSIPGVSDGYYYIVMHHRNHLSLMSASSRYLTGISSP
ncbi:hypothetical protein JW835_12635 [bacterium]|nr:hypothetical protein [bacterium]